MTKAIIVYNCDNVKGTSKDCEGYVIYCCPDIHKKN